MRNPSRNELTPIVNKLHEVRALQRRHALELRPLQDDLEELVAKLACECGVPPGPMLDEMEARWVHPQTRKPLIEEEQK